MFTWKGKRVSPPGMGLWRLGLQLYVLGRHPVFTEQAGALRGWNT
jgi:hypothetical protein